MLITKPNSTYAQRPEVCIKPVPIKIGKMTSPQNGCGGNEEKKEPLLCSPDPFKKLCQKKAAHNKKKAKYFGDESVFIWALEFPDQYASYVFEKYFTEEEKKSFLGTSDPNKMILKLSQHASELFLKEAQKYQNKFRDRINKVTRKSAKALIQTIDESVRFSADEKDILKKQISNCADNTAEVTLDTPGVNAFFHPAPQIDHLVGGDITKKEKNACKITLTPEMMVSCAESDADCYATISHELGHALNSCTFIRSVDSRSFANFSTYTPFQDHPFLNVNLKEEKQIKILSDLSTSLEESTKCLDAISQPLRSISNSCIHEFPKELQIRFRSYFEKCGMPGGFGFEGYPTQWMEAEADFWSASVLAKLIQNDYSDEKERNDAAEEMLSSYCEESMAMNNFALKKVTASASKRNGLLFEEKLKNALRGYQKECFEKPEKGVHPEKIITWKDHQHPHIRVNKNYLRNSDLREALGCKPTPEIGYTCTPRGTIHIAVPQ